MGCGWAGARHARAFAAAGAEVAWAVDVDLARARSLGAEHNATHAAEALADRSVCAVSVCLPHALHAETVIQALAVGKHVLVEKPLAATLEQADHMISAADAAGTVLMVAESVCFDPPLTLAADLVHQGVIGEPALAQISREAYLRDSFLRERRWFLDEMLAGGGIMLSGGVHVVRVDGDSGSLRLDLRTRSLRVFSEHAAWRREGACAEHELRVDDADPFELEVAHFLTCIRTGAAPLTSARDQRRPLELALAAYASMRTGRPVAV